MGDRLTEKRNKKSENLHEQTTMEIIQLMNEQDKTVAHVVESALPQIEKSVEAMVTSIDHGGHVVYFGAGTSGRLGVLDASECPPTFGVSPDLIQGVIAGGDEALRIAVENAEDSRELARSDVEKYVMKNDVVVGIASSGNTPYVLEAIVAAQEIGARTIGIACNNESELSALVDIAIELPVGPEIVTGSTRLKAGTAQKMVLNMLSTTTMIKTGKVYQNLMVNVQATNNKLRERAISIIMELTDVDYETAKQTNEVAKGDTRIAIIMLLFQIDLKRAKEIMEKYEGNFIKVIKELGSD